MGQISCPNANKKFAGRRARTSWRPKHETVPLDNSLLRRIGWVRVPAKDLPFLEHAELVRDAVQIDALLDADPGLPLELPAEDELDELERVPDERVVAEAGTDETLDGELNDKDAED